MAQYLTVKNKAHLDTLKNHTHGEIAYCEDTKELWIYNENEKKWTKYQIDNQGINLNLYDLNKSIINQLEPLSSGEIALKMALFNEYYEKANNTYHMLLCKDFNYYTIFNQDFTLISSELIFSDFPSVITSIITELGEVYSVELLEDGTMEIWIKPTGEESPYAFYLFPYDAGVVYYG